MARNKKHDLKILTNKILRVINESSNKAVKEQLFPPGSTGTTTGTAVWADPSGWEQSIACKLNGACTNTGLPHQNPCNFLQKRYNANYSDLASLVANTMGGGATGTGTNPLWQNQLAYKLFHLFNIGLMNSYGIFWRRFYHC